MSKIRIHELSLCEKEDSELHDVVGGESSFLKYDDSFFFGKRPVGYYTPEAVIYPTTDAYVESVEETVVNKDGYYGQAKVVKGRTNGRKFVRAFSSARA
ncbi:hypothetical protein Riv7116_3456 [Rivularia sp. PCC 7116]|uniref:hypothetical protein n=1 Tax=Rivularia sp. PCC 7116 TaxID=373994 RepID=UPI00029F3161|nr:hypothetical protein [Rivularia sp. PCC 7116]AFY55911.1 hypothetical protein Riv7116_3456 [Rivularia sp. PCC 7116]